jgi:Zn-finger nucleic acid-binding protein
MADRQGIEIDYCPQCRGVWLDRGELDKIIERSAQPSSGSHDHHRHDQHHHDDHYYKKQKSLLTQLLDF